MDYKLFRNNTSDASAQTFRVQNRIGQKTAQRMQLFGRLREKAEHTRKLRKEKFLELIAEYNESRVVQRMSGFIQHGDTTTLEHCKSVAWVSFAINRKLHLNSDEKELMTAAMLHDFYLYDWHDGKPERKTHGFDHPFIANENAKAYFQVSPKVSAAIMSHMWPLNITRVPNSREAVVLCLADKCCAVAEMIRRKRT